MNKKQFLESLENELIENNVKNIKDILAEYENHFIEGKKVGKSEKEICESLGSPEIIAADYNEDKSVKKSFVKKFKNPVMILIASICSVVLIVALVAVIIVASRVLDDRTIVINYKQDQVSLMSFREDNLADFRFLSEEFVVDKGETFYIAVEQKPGYVVKNVKIDGIDITKDVLSANNSEKLKNLSENLRNFILSNTNSVFIKVSVADNMNIEIICENI